MPISRKLLHRNSRNARSEEREPASWTKESSLHEHCEHFPLSSVIHLAHNGSQRSSQRGEREIHPFVLIANHQLSEKRRPAPEILRSILTSRRVARVRNFTFGPTGFQGLPTHPTVRLGYISRPGPVVHPARPSVSAHLAPTDRVRTRARSYQLVHTWASERRSWTTLESCCSRGSAQVQGMDPEEASR